MAHRTCANCGKQKLPKGERICENGYFICKDCVWSESGLLSKKEIRRCSIDQTSLRYTLQDVILRMAMPRPTLLLYFAFA